MLKHKNTDCIGGVKLRVLASSVVVRWFEHFKNQTKLVGQEQSGPYHHFIENELALAMI